MRTIDDKQLGEIKVRLLAQSRHIRFRLSPRGEMIVTAPSRTPILVIKQAIRSSRVQLQQMLTDYQQSQSYTDQQAIGKSHRLAIVESSLVAQPTAKTKHRQIIITVPTGTSHSSPEVQRLAQTAVLKAIRKEAKAYLGRRLANLANRYDFTYTSVRYTHTGTRWGSCSSQGTISLNIALMKLPLELIDYVLIHELCHTKQMNHSTAFWDLVASCLPDYKLLRRRLKAETSSL